MFDPFLTKSCCNGLPEADASEIAEAYTGASLHRSGSTIVARDVASRQIHVLVEGWACKQRLLSSGARQLVLVHLPGEIVDIDKIYQEQPAFSVTAKTDCKILSVPLDRLRALIQDHPAIRDLLWSLTVAENAALIEQIVSLGRRSPRQRIAHLLCDLLARLEALGDADDDRFRLILTQSEIADLFGMSTVHLNKTMQELKRTGLIKADSGRQLIIRDRKGLESLAEYGPSQGISVTSKSLPPPARATTAASLYTSH